MEGEESSYLALNTDGMEKFFNRTTTGVTAARPKTEAFATRVKLIPID